MAYSLQIHTNGPRGQIHFIEELPFLRNSHQWNASALLCFSVAVVKHWGKMQLGIEKDLSGLHIIVHYLGKPRREVSQGGSLKQKPHRNPACWLDQLLFFFFFFVWPRPICPGIAPPTLRGWGDCLYQLANNKMPLQSCPLW